MNNIFRVQSFVIYLEEEQPQSVILDDFISHVFWIVLESKPEQRGADLPIIRVIWNS